MMILQRLFLLFIFIIAVVPAIAQDEPPAPEFLLRQDNQLLLIDGYTGESTTLPIELGEYDKVEWSPNGTYLVVRFDREDKSVTCINLYNIDLSTWISTDPISCDVKELLLLEDDSQLFYVTTDERTDVIWSYEISSQSTTQLYETREGDTLNDVGVSSLELSPNQQYLFFREYDWLMGGTDNYLVVMNLETTTYTVVMAPDPYYADYNPIWSSDDSWFLIRLMDEYLVSFSVPRTNHKGDVYLVNADDGEQYRITYTPAIEENNIHWTNDGEIAFTEVIIHDITLTIDEAQAITPILFTDIIQPEEVDYPDHNKYWAEQSPDPNVSAWFGTQEDDDGNKYYTLQIGMPYAGSEYPEDIIFSAKSEEELLTDTIAIGWRPTDFVYPQD